MKFFLFTNIIMPFFLSFVSTSIHSKSSQNSQSNHGVIYATVGPDANCDFKTAPNGTQTIQDAIDVIVFDEIRLTNNTTFNENIIISNQSLVLKGGYDSCDKAEVDDVSNTTTTISGVANANSPVIRVFAPSDRRNIQLKNLSLSNGSGSISPGGGIGTYGANANIEIINTNIFFNTSTAGGGLFISGGNTAVSLIDSGISFNTASYAGGIFCTGEDTSITMSGKSGISQNTANGSGPTSLAGKGGGLFLKDSCRFTNYSGSASGLGIVGIQGNSATAEGGGIFAIDGAELLLYGHKQTGSCSNGCLGDNKNPVNLNSNQANSDGIGTEGGGGAFLSGLGTHLQIYAGYIADNYIGINNASNGNGGGIYIESNAQFSSGRLLYDCWDRDRCNYFKGNKAGRNSENGGAIYNSGGTINIFNSYFEDNRATSGTAIASNSSGVNNIEGSIFNHNGDLTDNTFIDGQVIIAQSNASYNMKFNTFADNNVLGNIILLGNDAGHFSIQASLFHDVVPVINDTNTQRTFNCIMAHETSSFNGINSMVADPLFLDRNNRNYHLSKNSPAIDFCNQISSLVDIDMDPRGFDLPNTNFIGAYDLGADEVGDLIYKSGYE